MYVTPINVLIGTYFKVTIDNAKSLDSIHIPMNPYTYHIL